MLEMCFNCDYCEEQNGDYFAQTVRANMSEIM